jgi:hypothetical protein
MVTNLMLGIEFVKVISTQVLKGLIVSEHEINGNEQTVFDRANGALFSAPAR